MAISNRPTTQVKVKVETNTAIILAQLMIAATLAVPIGMLAAAAGMAVSRNQGGQVRIAYYAVSPSPTPSPSPSPVGTLPAPTNFQVTSVSNTSIGLNWDLVPGAVGYAVYNNGVRMTVFSPNPVWINGYYLNNLASGAVYVLQVAAMGADAAEGKKTGSKTATTQPKVNKCERTTHVSKQEERIVAVCAGTDKKATCDTAKSLTAIEMLKVTCEDPCKRYAKTKPPTADTPACRDLTEEEVEVADEASGFPNEGYKYLTCNAYTDVICKVGTAPEGATEF